MITTDIVKVAVVTPGSINVATTQVVVEVYHDGSIEVPFDSSSQYEVYGEKESSNASASFWSSPSELMQ